MKNIKINLLLLIALSFSVWAATSFERITSKDFARVGSKNSTANKGLEFEDGVGGQYVLRANFTEGRFEQSFDSGSNFEPVGSGSGSGGGGGRNIILNPSMEDGTGTPLNWTASGGSLSRVSYANGTEDDEKYASYTASSGQYIESDALTVPDNLGFGCMADIQYKQGQDFDYSVIENGTTTIASASFSSITDWQKSPTITFRCPDSGDTIALRISATSGSSTINLDHAYLGSNKGIIPAEFKSEFVEKVLLAPITNSSGTVSDFTISGLEIGATYRISGKVTFRDSDSGADNPKIVFKNGVTDLGNLFQYTHHPINGATQVQSQTPNTIFTATDSTFTVETDFVGCVTVCQLLGNGTKDASGSFIQLTKLSSKAVQAFTPEQADFYIYSKIASTAGQNTGIGLNVVPNEPTLEITNYLGSQASITCTGGNPSGNPNCSTGNEQLGIEFNAPVAGTYRVCTSFSSGDFYPLYMIETGLNSDTAIQTGPNSNYRNASSSTEHFCNTFEFSSAGTRTIKLLGGSGSVSAAAQIYTENQATSGTRGVVFEVQLLQNHVARPVIQNMVATPRKTGIDIVTCRVTGASVEDGESGCSEWIDSLIDGSGSTEYALNSKFIGRKILSCNCNPYSNTPGFTQAGAYCVWGFSSIGGSPDNPSTLRTVTSDTNSPPIVTNQYTSLTCFFER